MGIDATTNRPTQRAVTQPLQTPVVTTSTAEPAPKSEAASGLVNDLFQAASTVPPAVRERVIGKALSLVLGNFGLGLPDPSNPGAFWQSVEKASTTPMDANDASKGTQLHALAMGIASLVIAKRPELVSAPPDAGKAFTEGVAQRLEQALMGEAHRTLHEGYPSWGDLNRSVTEAVAQSQGTVADPTAPGSFKPTPVSNPAFISELEKLTGGVVLNDSKVSVFGREGNGAAMQERLKMIANASQSIDCAVWKVYGDETGEAFVEALEQKMAQSPGFKARLVVDGNVAQADPKSMALLDRLKAAGVEVMLFHDPAHPANGMHWKGMIADAQTSTPSAISGGRNIGDEYLEDGQWRDTDVRTDGRGALGLSKDFATLWNTGAGFSGQAQIHAPTADEVKQATIDPSLKSAQAQHLNVVDLPGPANNQGVAKGLLKAIQGAEKEINIQQGYFLEVPAVLSALEERAKAGVQINIHANSKESNDVPGLDMMGKATLARMAALPNVHVFTQKSERNDKGLPLNTLHSKWMTVDGSLGVVGSWNQHGRSMILEAEGMSFFNDPAAIAKLNADFKADVANSNAETADSLHQSAEQLKLVDMLELLGVAYI